MGKAMETFEGTVLDFFQIDCGLDNVPMLKTFPPSSRCFAARALVFLN